MTSGTLKRQEQAFYAPGRSPGWEGRAGVQEYVAESLFPMKRIVCYTCQRRWSIEREEAGKSIDGGKSYPFPDSVPLYGHRPLVLFTLIRLWEVCTSDFKRQLAISHGGSMDKIRRKNPPFKTMENGVLFAAVYPAGKG